MRLMGTTIFFVRHRAEVFCFFASIRHDGDCLLSIGPPHAIKGETLKCRLRETGAYSQWFSRLHTCSRVSSAFDSFTIMHNRYSISFQVCKRFAFAYRPTRSRDIMSKTIKAPLPGSADLLNGKKAADKVEKRSATQSKLPPHVRLFEKKNRQNAEMPT